MQESSNVRPQLGISACLLGAPVRYNGAHTRNDWITKTLAAHCDFVPLCPEVEMGLGTPRAAMRLTRPGRASAVRLVTSQSSIDHTELALRTVQRLIAALPGTLDGYILMSRSPLCGDSRVKIYDAHGIPGTTGPGFFAEALRTAFPNLPVIDVGRFADPVQREHYVMRLFTWARFKRIEPSVAALQTFHREHKFLLLACHGEMMRVLGRIAADAKPAHREAALRDYSDVLARILEHVPSRGRMADALVHIYAFVKTGIGSVEKASLRAKIDEYRRGRLPLLVPLTLLAYVNEVVRDEYVTAQRLFAPYPEMGLRLGV